MKKVVLVTFFVMSLLGSFNAQGQVKYALNAFFDYPTPLMSDGKIVLELVGNYPNPVEFHILFGSPIISVTITDSLTNMIESDFSSTLVVHTVDAVTQDTILETAVFPTLANDLYINWNMLQNTTNDFLCDGSFYANLSGPVTGVNINWLESYEAYLNGDTPVALPGLDSLYAINQCAGMYSFDMSLSGSVFISGVYIGPLTTSSGLIDVDVYSTPSSIDSCTSIATSTVTGGVPPYQYYWDFIAGNSDQDSLCPGLHSLKVVDANSDSTLVLFGVADSNFWYNDPFSFGTIDDTIYFLTENCGLNFSIQIDSIEIAFADFYTDSTVAMGFLIWQAGTSTYIQDTASYGPPVYGTFLVDLTNFCLNKALGGQVIRYNGVYNYYLSLDELSESLFRLYPNPTSQLVNIIGEAIDRVDVYNLLGELVLTTYQHVFDMSVFPTGIYQVMVFNSGGEKLGTQKLIVQK